MEVSVTGQAQAFLGTLALGGGLGLTYDLFRLLRSRLPWRWLKGALDLLYWPLAVCALFLYAVAAGDGEIRIYFMLGIFLGGVLYFLTLSPAALWLGARCADFLAYFGKLALLPLTWAGKTGKKFGKNLKKTFHSWTRWYKIKSNIGEMERLERAEGGGGHGDQTGRFSHQAGGTGPHHRRQHHPSADQRRDPGGPGPAG